MKENTVEHGEQRTEKKKKSKTKLRCREILKNLTDVPNEERQYDKRGKIV